MENSSIYNGVVTLIIKRGDKTLTQKYYNNGTNLLFELYSRALSGQNVSRMIPSYIDIVDSTDESTHHITTPVPVIVTYGNPDRGTYEVPFTRVEAILTKKMINPDITINKSTTSTLKLMTSSENVLAHTTINELMSNLNELPEGTHMIIVWDLYVTNKSPESGGNS